MGKSIYLPPASDTITNIQLEGKNVKIDTFDMEVLFMEAQNKANEMGTEWNDEFPKLFEKKTKAVITSGQSTLLWYAHRQHMEELKKSLFQELENSRKPVTNSKRKQSKKK